MVCENAAKHDHVCMCVMCIHCYNKCKAMRQNQLDKHDDQETISLFYIFIIIHFQEKLMTNKTFTFGKI